MNSVEYKQMPDHVEPDVSCTLIDTLTNQSEMFYAKFAAILNLTKYDKLCINDNKLCIQKLAPWRYFVRKYKNQNKGTLAVYLNTEIVEYEYFIHKLCRECNDHVENVELHGIAMKQYDFIKNSLNVIKSLRDKYNLTPNSSEISAALETWYLKLTKFKPVLLEIVLNPQFANKDIATIVIQHK